MLNVEVPAVVRIASKCARPFFKLVDLQKIGLFKPESELDDLQKVLLESSSKDDKTKVVGMTKVDFFEEAFKVIG